MESNNNIAKMTPTWHYNLLGHFFVLLIIFIIICTIIIIKGNLFSKQIDIIKEMAFDYSAKLGLTLDDIVIEGRDKVSQNEILSLLELDRSSSFLEINEKDLEKLIKTLPWVQEVKIKKTYLPNVLQIGLREKEVVAIYQLGSKFYGLDEKGQIIKTDFKPNKEMIVVLGKGAPEHVLSILKIVSKNKDVYKRIKALQYISERRWNVVLDDIKDGKIIKLPQDNYEQAWKKLLKLNVTHGLLKRPLTIIDLRFEDKVILKLNKHPLKQGIKEVKT